jgi:cation diffusion facilitator CzcD-associated flavoprotein CzcO
MADFTVKPLEADLDFGQLHYWDVVIIGAGPAGLAAGLTTAHRALTTLVIEAKDKPGGQPQFLYADKRIVDIPGFPDVSVERSCLIAHTSKPFRRSCSFVSMKS